MTLDHIFLPHRWRRYFAIARVVLGLGCLLELFLRVPAGSLYLTGAALGLLVYALLVPWNRRMYDVFGGRLVLALDTLYFFVAVAVQGEGQYWLGAAFAAFLLFTAALLNGWIVVLILAAASVVYLAVVPLPSAHALLPGLLEMTPFAVVLALQRQTLMDRLSNLSQQVVILKTEAEEARSAERKRIAADFHDGPLQSFISFQMRLEIVRKALGKDLQSGLDQLTKLQDLCRDQVTELRTFVRSMRPLESGSSNLTASIMRIVQEFQRESGIQVSFSGGDGSGLQDVEANSEVLQVLREALHNTQKHSAASRVLISAARRNGSLEFSVQDDGCGFPFSGTFTLAELQVLRLGPESIKRRVEGLKGDLLLESKPGKGSRLEIHLPI